MNPESSAATGARQTPARPTRFSAPFPTTRRGAHTARHAAERWLAAHGLPPGESYADTVVLLIAELTANAAVHGRVRGREARLTVTLDVAVAAGAIRVEVTDARGDRLPVCRRDGSGESGRGLLLVDHLADDWGVLPYHPGGKTVWAVCTR